MTADSSRGKNNGTATNITSFASPEYFFQRGSQSPSPPVSKNGSTHTLSNNNSVMSSSPPSRQWSDLQQQQQQQQQSQEPSQGFDHQTWSEFHLRPANLNGSTTSSTSSSNNNAHTNTTISVVSTHSSSNDDSSFNKRPMPGEEADSSVVVSLKDAGKSYGKACKRVLEDLNMTVCRGDIYGLLGASGCGKTTVLSCVVGCRTLDKGRISVFGGIPGDRRTGVPGKRVGYMPQELALYLEFTIKETLDYFGRIYGMERSKVQKEVDFLLSLLDLPPQDRVIRTLSGGQQRRVSFAVSLLHNPELLILDEPTVGVDPMLRQSIWSHLTRLVTEQEKTIIITTHYIEEARQASVVGLMRHGRLLAEGPPLNLLETYGLPTLEEVFLKLCIRDTSGSDDGISRKRVSMTGTLTGTLTRLTGTARRNKQRGNLVYPGITGLADDTSIQPISYARKESSAEETEFQKIKRRLSMKKRSSKNGGDNCKRSPSWQWTFPHPTKINALMSKNFIKLWRNLGQLLFVFLLPAIQVVFFCVAIGRDPSDLPIAVVNNELEGSSIAANASCDIAQGCVFTDVSCRLLANIFSNESSLVATKFDDLDSALGAVRRGEAWGALEVPANFSKFFLKRLWSSIDADRETLNKSSINVFLDQSNQQVSFVLKRSLKDGYDDFYRGIMTDCEFPEEASEPPLIIREPIYGPEEPSFTDFMAPGIIILIIFFLALALTGEMFIVEKREGLLDRSWIAGVLPSEVLISHVVTQFLILLGQTAITLVFILLVFGIPCKGPVGWLIGLTLLQGTAGMCYGLLLSTLFTDLATSMQMAIGSFYPCLLLSGILWPVEGMPWYLREVAWYLPCTLACQAMRDVMSRGWDITSESVYLGYIASISWIAVFLILCWLVIKIKAN